jgi:hypothetical protein
MSIGRAELSTSAAQPMILSRTASGSCVTGLGAELESDNSSGTSDPSGASVDRARSDDAVPSGIGSPSGAR